MSEQWSDDEDNGKRRESTADGGQKRGVINRVNRACNNCRRMKMRCIGAEDPPCKRCRNSGLECIMEKPGKQANEQGEDRIRSLESQVSSMQNTLTDLVQTLRAGMSSRSASSSEMAPMGGPSPDFNPMIDPVLQTAMSMSGRSPYGGMDGSAYRRGSTGSGPTPPFFAPGGSAMAGRSPSVSTAAFPMGGVGYGATPADMSAISAQELANISSIPGNPHRSSMAIVQSIGDPSPRKPPAPAHALAWPPSTSKHLTTHESLPPSRAGSNEPDDILGPDDITNPLGAMSSMAGLVEAAVERAREEAGTSVPGKRPSETVKAELANRPVKKARFSPDGPTGPVVVESQHLPPISTQKGKPQRKVTHIHAYPDAVAEGYVTEEEGREMMKIFYAGSANFIPCYDPNVDTWESLRTRSPFSITSIIMVGARVRDGGGPVSDVQKACRNHAQRIAVGTLFSPVARIEAVQAMILLSAFSEAGWLPGGHAVRMAIDMGINRSFIMLLRSGMGKGKSKAELEEERHLVVHSRVWFCLYLMEHQYADFPPAMAYGTGRPAILREDESIHQCRKLLEHPLSITSDARLVSTVELMALRAPLHIELTAAPDIPIAESTLRRLKQANSDFDAWERYWDRILSERFGKGRGDFFRESLIIQRQYAELFVNSQLLRGIREPTDVIDMPEEKRALAIRAMKNAQRIIEICLHGENYRNGLRYAVHYTHVCAAFAASFLIRIARLFPNELNLKKTAKDVEELAGVLSTIPAGRYARSLRLILRRARRAKVIPAASIVSSPTRQPLQLPPGATSTLAPTPTPGQPSSTPGFSPSQMLNTSYYPTPTPGASGSANPAGAAQGNTGLSPNSLFNPSFISDSSPASADLFEFDNMFAVEAMERAGISFGDGDQLPLFLDGQSLGATQNASEMTNFVGMEQFFLPSDIDNMLGGPSVGGDLGNGNNGAEQPAFNGDVWW